MMNLMSPKISELATYFLQSQPECHQNYYRARQIAGSQLGGIRIGKLTVTDLSRYRDERMEGDGIAAQTFHHEINMLRAIIRHARVELGMQTVPDHAETFSLLKMPVIDGERDRRLLPGEWDALWSCATLSMKRALIVAIETGMRRGEACQLRWEHVCFETRTITLPSSITKTKRKRRLPMSRLLTETLAKAKKQEGLVLGMSSNALGLRWARLRAKAENICPSLNTFRFHDFRHECISRLAERGWSLPQLQIISGHTTWRMLQRYVNLRADDLVDKLDDGDAK